MMIGEFLSTAQRSNRGAQQVKRGALLVAARMGALAMVTLMCACTPAVESQLDAAQLEMRQGAYDRAVVIFSQVLEAVPDAPNVHTNMGFALMQLGRYEEAVSHFEQAHDGGAADATLLHNWAGALAKLHRLDEAETRYAQAAAADPGRSALYVNWGNVLVDLGRLDEAAQRYQQAVENDPESAIGWFNHGYTLERLSEHEAALISYRTFLSVADGAPSDLLDHASRFVAQADAASGAGGGS